MNKDHTREAQEVMLEILKAFDGICKKYHLTYWLDHGTLLGAVRHQGFIPWDDDLDVTMPREDYEEFLKVASHELDEHYFLQTQQSDHCYLNFFPKIRDRHSTFIDEWETKHQICYHQGIYIDIFPLNTIPKNKRYLYHFLVSLSKIFHNRFIKNISLTAFWVRMINKMHTMHGDYVVSGGENMRYVIHVDKETIYPLSKVTFENHMFPAPRDYHNYLRSIFGDTYMQLPPLKLRKRHSALIEPNQPCRYEKEHHV